MKDHISLIVVGVIILVMALTCPGREDHVDAVSEAYTQKNIILNIVGKNRISFVADKVIKVDNYVLFSVGKYMMNDNRIENVVSMGIFGHVYTFMRHNVWEEIQRVM